METEQSLIGAEVGGATASTASSGPCREGLRTVAVIPRLALSTCVVGLSVANGVVLLRGVLGEFSEALAQGAASALETRPCHVAAPGDKDVTCYQHIVAVLADDARAIREHPESYPGLSPASIFEEVQSFLHEHQPQRSHCPLPCSVGSCHIATHDDLDQTCFRVAYAAVHGGINEHPERYPGLSASSGFVDFQRHFHERQPEMNCPRPCQSPYPAFYGFAWTLLAAIVLLPAFTIICDWARGKTEWRYRFFALYLSMLVPLNTRLYALAKWGFVSTYSHYEQFGHTWQWFSPSCFFAYAWAFLCIMQHLHRPVKAPNRRHTVFGFLGLYVGFATAVFYMCFTGGMSASPHMSLGFPLDSESLFPVMSLTMAEAVRFVNTAEPHGVLALLPMLVFFSTYPAVLFRGDNFTHWVGLDRSLKQDASFYVAVFSGAEALSLLLAGCDLRPRPVSTSWEFAGAGVAPEVFCATARHFFLSWRGQNCLYLANGVFSLALYGSEATRLKAILSATPWDVSGEEAFDNKGIFVDAIVVVSGISVLLAVAGLVADLPVRNHDLSPGPVLSRIPIDRHFRYTTVIKATMVWLQLEIFLCTDVSKLHGGLDSLFVFQLFAVVASLLVGLVMPFCMLLRVGRLVRFSSSHRGGNLLPVSAAACGLLLQLLAVVLLAGRALGPEGAVMRGLRATSAGIFLTFPCTYLVGVCCLLNELRWSLAALDAQQPHISAVASPSGVWAVAACAAVKFPLQALLEFVYNSWLRPWYVQDLFTGYAGRRSLLVGGGHPMEGLLPPVVAYCTLALALAGLCAGWASASPLGGGMPWLGTARTSRSLGPKPDRQQDRASPRATAVAPAAGEGAGVGVASLAVGDA